jgi:predicted nucleotide-binding protein (sugar kinase/HSP70/actin superfamily)
MFSDIRTNARDFKFDRIMKKNLDKLVITRERMSLIFYEEAPTIGVVLTYMIDGTKVVRNVLASPITSERIAHMKQVREKVFVVLNTRL